MTATGTRIEDAAKSATETMNATADYVTKQADELRERFTGSERRMREIVEEYPLTCFFGAVVAGYLVGRIATRL